MRSTSPPRRRHARAAPSGFMAYYTENFKKLSQEYHKEHASTGSVTHISKLAAKKYAELNSELQTKLVNANKYKNQLLSKLRKINLSKLSAEEPAVWERKINNASKEVLESFESITAIPSN